MPLTFKSYAELDDVSRPVGFSFKEYLNLTFCCELKFFAVHMYRFETVSLITK